VIEPYTREFVFKTPQGRVFGGLREVYVEDSPGVLTPTTLEAREVSHATSARLVSYTDEAGLRRMQVRFHLGRVARGAWQGALRDEAIVFNGRGYLQAGLHENEHTEERLLNTVAEFLDWNGVVADRPST